MGKFIEIIESEDSHINNKSIEEVCINLDYKDLLAEINELDKFRQGCENLYKRVRADFLIYAIYRFYLPKTQEINLLGKIPYDGYLMLLKRRFEEAIEILKTYSKNFGLSDGLCSALASAYHNLGFQTLSDQVRKSVRSVKGNQWMFRIGHPFDQPLKLKPELQQKNKNNIFPIIKESTPVRMDLSHSGWSDIFFLGMDYPQGAKVINVSIDLSIYNETESTKPRPPISTYLRVIDKQILRLVSTDLEAVSEINTIDELFDFSKDYLGLLKAGIIASGIVPPGMEGTDQKISVLFDKLVMPGHGLELITSVNNIPKGSRLAVSTNLLASIITLCMRATGQTNSLNGSLSESERKIVVARAILGEWLGGSGGGWQDSGGVWDGIKVIEGVESCPEDTEFQISNGTLLPKHTVLDTNSVSASVRKKLQDSLVLVHGGMAQDVGPILEMVSEKYLLRSEKEWKGRNEALDIFDQILETLPTGDISALGKLTQQNFEGPIQTIIPWASNNFTELLIEKVKAEFGQDFYGFWMLGGMSGGGMGFMFNPTIKCRAQARLKTLMMEIKNGLINSVQFSIDPVVYNFQINDNGTFGEFLDGMDSFLPDTYYSITIPNLIKKERTSLTKCERAELDFFGKLSRSDIKKTNIIGLLFDRLLPDQQNDNEENNNLNLLLKQNGFDPLVHDQIKSELKSGRIGIAQNRLPITTEITDVSIDEIYNSIDSNDEFKYAKIGDNAIRDGKVAVVTLAGGAGSRWTKGAGVVKSLNPFAKFNSKYRSFIEVHLAKSKKNFENYGREFPHIFTTSFLTYKPIQSFLTSHNNFDYQGQVIVSPGSYVGQRLLPSKSDLKFLWEEMEQQILDEQEQKVLESTRKALLSWVDSIGEITDYTDNTPLQCLHPVGHWFEFPNLLKNGTLKSLLESNPNLKYLFMHNIDTLGANIDPHILGYHIAQNSAISAEVINRRIEDRGGGLAKVNGNLRLIEGMALPDEKLEFNLSFYNTASNFIDIDKILSVFNLSRTDLENKSKVEEEIRNLSQRIPTYITVKDVKKRWGKGQEDIYPLLQFEKLWGDMTAISELNCQYILVSRNRGQQLKEPSQLDGWLRDGSADYVNSLCSWS